jgi:hypothetical protein
MTEARFFLDMSMILNLPSLRYTVSTRTVSVREENAK